MQISKYIQTIKESLEGKEHDYTSGSLKKAALLLAVPMILELSLESVFALVDMYFVAKLGPAAIATVGLTESVITIIYSVAMGLSTAATAIVARRIGEKSPEEASKAGAQAIFISLVITLLLSIPGAIYAEEILGLMGAQQDVIKTGAVFTRIMLGGSIVIILIFVINGIFRGAGNAAMAMKSLWLASIINIILCPVLIQLMGLKGAAVATVIGRGTGVLYQCYHLFNGQSVLNIKWSRFKPNFTLIRHIIDLGWPATMQFIIASGSWIVLTRLVSEAGGTDASAGYQVAIRNVVFFILPAWGLSNAAATLVGQNLGAGKIDRAEKSVFLTAKYNAIFMGFVTLLFVGFAEDIVSIFTQDQHLIPYGAQSLRIIGYGYVFYGIGMVMTQALNGAGDTRTPTLINFIGFWCFQIPLAYVLAYNLNLKETGAFIAIPVAETCIALMALWAFKRGKWKTIKV